MWYVIVLIWLALVVGIIWAYNKKQRQRGAERAKQLNSLLSELKTNPNPVAATAGGAAVPVAAAPLPELSRKQCLLPHAEALLYYVFRAGLPDHEIFASLTLADVIDIAPGLQGNEREQKTRQLAQQRLDLVVCTKQLEIVAAVMAGKEPAATQAGQARFAEECLQAAGIRLVRIDPSAPPRHHEVRALVYGAGAQSQMAIP